MITSPKHLEPMDGPIFKNLRNITRDRKKLKFVLGKIYELRDRTWVVNDQWRDAVVEICGWTEFSEYQISRAIGTLCIHDYLIEVRDEKDRLKYHMLTEKAWVYLGIERKVNDPDKNLPVPAVKKPMDARSETAIDPDGSIGNALIKLAEINMLLADAGERLKINRQKVDELEKEYEDIIVELQSHDETAEILKKILVHVQGG